MNAMIHTDEQIEQVCKSISRFGFTVPILTDESDMILAGHARQRAALQLKLKKVPVIRKLGLSKQEKSAYVIADNKIARNAEFDWQILSKELKMLRDDGFDLDLTGFRDYEYGPLLEAVWNPASPDGTDPSEFAAMNAIKFTADQWEIVQQGVEKVRKDTDDSKTTDGRCIELIVADYLAGP